MNDDEMNEKVNGMAGAMAFALEEGEVPELLVIAMVNIKDFLEQKDTHVSVNTKQEMLELVSNGTSHTPVLGLIVSEANTGKIEAKVRIPLGSEVSEDDEVDDDKVLKTKVTGIELILSEHAQKDAHHAALFVEGFLSSFCGVRSIHTIEIPQGVKDKILEMAHLVRNGGGKQEQYSFNGKKTGERFGFDREKLKRTQDKGNKNEATPSPFVPSSLDLLAKKAEEQRQLKDLMAKYGKENIEALAKKTGISLESLDMASPVSKKRTPITKKPKKSV